MNRIDRARDAKKKLHYVGEPEATRRLEPTTYVRTAEQKEKDRERNLYLERVFQEKLKQKRQKRND